MATRMKPTVNTPAKLRWRMAQVLDELEEGIADPALTKLKIAAAGVMIKSYGNDAAINHARGIIREIDFLEDPDTTPRLSDEFKKPPKAISDSEPEDTDKPVEP